MLGSKSYSESYSYSDGASGDGSLTKMTTGTGYTLNYTYDSLKRLQKTQVKSGTTVKFTTAYAYRTISGNRSSAQVEFRNVRTGGDSGTILEGKKYSYDARGNITMISQSTGNYYPLVAYEYDSQNQLTKETYYDGAGTGSSHVTDTYVYTYDTAGNLLTVKKNGTTIQTYTYSTGNWKDQLTAINGNSIVYDNSGNPTTYRRGTSTDYDMTWTNGRQLTYINCAADQWMAFYSYNADGIRTKKIIETPGDCPVSEYITQNGKVVRETRTDLHGDTNIVLDFIYDESGRPFALNYSTNNGSTFTTYYYILNLQGDVVKLVNESGAAYATYSYDAWGNILSSSGTLASVNPLRYRGYYYDTETGWYYLQSRYYDPVIHRFTNADAFASTGQGVLGCNMFAYCNNNPPCRTDSLGCQSDRGIWSLTSDEEGAFILFHWLFGRGEDCCFVGETWGRYMSDNQILSTYIISIVESQAQELSPGESRRIDITTAAEIDNGEDIIGYQYLHGTNADVGGLRICGYISKDASGKTLYNINCTWNDIIDPNYYYASDRAKAALAKLMPMANPTDYKISITWNMKNHVISHNSVVAELF